MWLSGSPGAATLLTVSAVLAALTAMFGNAGPVQVPELLPIAVRSTGLSLVYAIGTSLFGGTTQFVVTWLLAVIHIASVPTAHMTTTYQAGAMGLWVDAGAVVIPHIRAVAAMFPELNIIRMPSGTGLVDKDQLVLGAVERPHARAALHPHHDVLELRVDLPTSRKQFIGVPPIHANVMNGSISAVLCEQSAGLVQELDELVAAELPRALGKLAMSNLALPGHMALYRNIEGGSTNTTSARPSFIKMLNAVSVVASPQ